MKKQNGITLVSLVITIVLMLIVASTTVYTSMDRFEINKLKKMYNDIELLSDKVSNYYLKYNELPVLRYENNEPVKYNYSDINEITQNEGNNKYIKKLDYIESTGTQYIDTGLKVKEGLNVELKARVINKYKSDGAIFLGSQESLSSMNFFVGIGWSWGKYSFGYGNGYMSISNVSPKLNEDIIIKTMEESIEINGTTCTGSNNGNIGVFNGTEYNIYLFGRNNAGNIDERCLAGRIYYCKLYDGDTLVRDYIPVIDENGVACLYDKVERKYYYNAGTGEFKTNLEEGGTITDEPVIEKGDYHIIDLSAMEGISLNYGKEGFENPNRSDDVYIINEKTHQIYYVKGIVMKGVTYYTLENKDTLKDNIPPSKPELNIISGDLNSDGKYTSDVEIEIIPGKDNWSGVKRTTYSINDGTEIDITTLTNNILKITENGTYTIKLKTYDNNSQISQEEISFEIKKISEKAYIVTLGQGSYFKEASYINKIKTISFVKGIDSIAVSNAIKTYELGNTTYGTEKNEVMGWIDSNYNLYIGSESTIYSKSLGYAFYNMNAVTNITFNNLNTSECTSMYVMFAGCSGLTTLNLSSFNTSQVTSMTQMFSGCSGLTTLNLSSFNTSKVTDMSTMFFSCKKLTTLDLSNFNTSKVIHMYQMFSNCNKLTTLDLRNFDTSQVTTMHSMFYGCSELTTLDVSSFNTSKVSNMYGMFNGCSELTTLDLSSFNTNKVTNMQAMFYNCNKLTTLDLRNFDTSQVTTMHSMFYGCSELTTLDVSSFNTSKVSNMYGMFANCIKLTTLDVSSFNTNKVTNMQNMFSNCNKLTTLDLRSFDTSQVTAMNGMFYGCSELRTLDLSGFNTNKVRNMYGVFYGCSKLKTIYVKQYDETTNTGWTTSAATNSADLFYGCTSIVGGNGTTYNSSYKNATYARIDTVEEPGYFTNILDKAE